VPGTGRGYWRHGWCPASFVVQDEAIESKEDAETREQIGGYFLVDLDPPGR
jgi:hypothetical protein